MSVEVPQPAVLLVYEHLIAHPPARGPRWLVRWTTDSRMSERIHAAHEVTPYRVDAITFLGQRFANKAESRVAAEHLPLSNMLYGDLDVFSKLNTEYEVIVHACDDYVGRLGDSEVFLRTPYAFDLPGY